VLDQYLTCMVGPEGAGPELVKRRAKHSGLLTTKQPAKHAPTAPLNCVPTRPGFCRAAGRSLASHRAGAWPVLSGQSETPETGTPGPATSEPETGQATATGQTKSQTVETPCRDSAGRPVLSWPVNASRLRGSEMADSAGLIRPNPAKTADSAGQNRLDLPSITSRRPVETGQMIAGQTARGNLVIFSDNVRPDVPTAGLYLVE
jgi:hypothetical protein